MFTHNMCVNNTMSHVRVLQTSILPSPGATRLVICLLPACKWRIWNTHSLADWSWHTAQESTNRTLVGRMCSKNLSQVQNKANGKNQSYNCLLSILFVIQRNRIEYTALFCRLIVPCLDHTATNPLFNFALLLSFRANQVKNLLPAWLFWTVWEF